MSPHMACSVPSGATSIAGKNWMRSVSSALMRTGASQFSPLSSDRSRKISPSSVGLSPGLAVTAT